MEREETERFELFSEEETSGGLDNLLGNSMERMPLVPGIRTVKEMVAEVREGGIEELTLHELIALRKAEAPMALIDLREPEERISGNKIRGAISIPRGLLEMVIGKHVDNANSLIVLFCSNTIRSILAYDTLSRMGYRNVKVLSGGFHKVKKSLKRSQSE